MPDIILEIAQRFHAAKYSIHIVGGTVRDSLLGRTVTPDTDLTTDATPDIIKDIIAPTHPRAVSSVGERFGTVQIHYDDPTASESDPDKTIILEITTFRSEQYLSDSRKPDVVFGNNLEEDLLRRDFTINAMAMDPLTGSIIDPFGGKIDLEAKIIRAVGNAPKERFAEDPLRMLRAVRFAAQLGFTIESSTAKAIQSEAHTLQKISWERIRDEMCKILLSPRPAIGLRLAAELGLAQYFMPEMIYLQGVHQRPGHSKDVFEHTMRVVQNSPATLTSRWAALLHDIAKPRTYSNENGQVHFFGHEDIGAIMAKDILRRLHFDKPFIEKISKIVKMHMRVNAYIPDWTDGAVRRMMLDAGEALPELLTLSRADITSYRQDKILRASALSAELDERCRKLREESERVPIKSPLDGNELMQIFSRQPGPWIKEIKEHLLSLVIDGALAPDDKEEAQRIADELLHNLPQSKSTPNVN